MGSEMCIRDRPLFLFRLLLVVDFSLVFSSTSEAASEQGPDSIPLAGSSAKLSIFSSTSSYSFDLFGGMAEHDALKMKKKVSFNDKINVVYVQIFAKAKINYF